MKITAQIIDEVTQYLRDAYGELCGTAHLYDDNRWRFYGPNGAFLFAAYRVDAKALAQFARMLSAR